MVRSILKGNSMLLCFLIYLIPAVGQDILFGDSSIDFRTATVDPLGHIFYATINNEVVKLELDGKNKTGFYSNNSLGNIKTIDVTNPFKILVWYPEFYTVIFLDRYLVEIDRQNLLDKGYGEILLAGHSRDGHIWLFDELDHKLKKMNLQGRTIAESEDLRLTLGRQIIPVKIRELGDKVYIITEENELLTFDLFANYLNRKRYPEIRDFQFSGDNLILFKTGEIEIVQLKTGEILQKRLPESYGDAEGKLLISNGQIWRITAQAIKSIDRL